jgi:hypothetical protein
VNRMIEIIKICLAPNRSDIHPANGMTAACASAYPVIVHWMTLNVLLKSTASTGMATFTAVVSRITMNIPIIMAISGAMSARIDVVGVGMSVAVFVDITFPFKLFFLLS